MKKFFAIILLIFAITLTGCDNPSAETECITGQTEVDGLCVNNEIVCETGQTEVDGACVVDEVDCDDNQHKEDGICVDDTVAPEILTDVNLEHVDLAEWQLTALDDFASNNLVYYHQDVMIFVSSGLFTKVDETGSTTTSNPFNYTIFVGYDHDIDTIYCIEHGTMISYSFINDSKAYVPFNDEWDIDTPYVGYNGIIHKGTLYNREMDAIDSPINGNIISYDPGREYSIYATNGTTCSVGLYTDFDDITPLMLDISEEYSCGEQIYMVPGANVFSLLDEEETVGFFCINYDGEFYTFLNENFEPSESVFTEYYTTYALTQSGIIYEYPFDQSTEYVVANEDLSQVLVLNNTDFYNIDYFNADFRVRNLNYETLIISDHSGNSILNHDLSDYNSISYIGITMVDEYLIVNITDNDNAKFHIIFNTNDWTYTENVGYGYALAGNLMIYVSNTEGVRTYNDDMTYNQLPRHESLMFSIDKIYVVTDSIAVFDYDGTELMELNIINGNDGLIKQYLVEYEGEYYIFKNIFHYTSFMTN